MATFLEFEQAAEYTALAQADVISAIKWNSAGLIPVIAQDASTMQVLMLAWMNKHALTTTIDTGRITYFSRSRNKLWCKGETSGHHQHLKELRIDCDGDTILCLVLQTGGACHTGRPHCFYIRHSGENFVVDSAAMDSQMGG